MQRQVPYEIYGFRIPTPLELKKEKGAVLLKHFDRPHRDGHSEQSDLSKWPKTSKVKGFDISQYGKSHHSAPNPSIDPALSIVPPRVTQRPAVTTEVAASRMSQSYGLQSSSRLQAENRTAGNQTSSNQRDSDPAIKSVNPSDNDDPGLRHAEED